MCDLNPIRLEQICSKEEKPPNWKPQDCESASCNECCSSIDPSKVFPPPPEPALVVDEPEQASADPFKLETVPFDPRFPNTNQTKHCYVSFLDYQRCIKLRGEDYAPCEYFKRAYSSLCPNAWVAKWNEQLEKGTFPGRI